MALSESRKKKLAMLTRAIAKGDFKSARELVRPAGDSPKRGQDGRTHRPGRPGVQPAPLGERPARLGEPGEAADSGAGDSGTADSGAAGSGTADSGTASGGPCAADERALQAAGRGPLPLEHLCPGVEHTTQTPAGGKPCWLIRKRLIEVDGEAVTIARDYAAVLRGARQRFDELQASAALCRAADARPEDLLFVDIETCGLFGAGIFLVGLMSYADGGLLFDQYFARDYAQEAAILQAFAARCGAAGVLVSFNGKTFDMNMIRERSAFHAVELPCPIPPHLDLLHESRRRWRRKLPNCRLQTLETHLCGRRRVGDIPGWAIPDAYHRFVDTGDARQVRDILHHNLLDLLTMAQLLTAILAGYDPVVE